MPFPVPSLDEITDRQLRDIQNALADESVDTGSDSDYAVRARAVAGVADGLYAHQGWIIRQIFPDTADLEYLELHCRQRNVYSKKATASSGSAQLTGTPDSVLPVNSEVRGQFGSVATTESAIIGADGKATVAVKSIVTGADTNTTSPFTAALVSPPEGISSNVTVGILTGGTDAEKDSSLLARYLEILRRPPAGGNKYDYRRWALEVDGVTSAYVEPLRRGLGTVDIAITSNNDLPPQALIDAVLAHIEDVRPVTAKDTMVVAPTKKHVDFLIRVKLSGLSLAAAKSAITDVITDFMNRLQPGQELVISQLETQISLIPGISDRKVEQPVSNVPAVIDETTWEWLRPGTVDVELFA